MGPGPPSTGFPPSRERRERAGKTGTRGKDGGGRRYTTESTGNGAGVRARSLGNYGIEVTVFGLRRAMYTQVVGQKTWWDESRVQPLRAVGGRLKVVGATIEVRVQPRARRNLVEVEEDGLVRVRVTAVPERGKANEAVVRLLADRLRVSKSSVSISKGQRGRNKTVSIKGLEASEVWERLRSGG